MKNFFDKCKDSTKNSDVYNEGVNFDMYSEDELMKKSVDELSVLLTDDSLFPYDETANTVIIRRICKVISKKEKIPKRVLKTSSKKAWKSFEKKYITPEPETTLVEIKIVETKKRKNNTLIKVLTTLAAAAIVILVVKFPTAIPQAPATDTEVTDLIETTTDTTPFFADESVENEYMSYGGVRFISTDDYEIVASGAKGYDDNSRKEYTIYSSGDKVFFISVSTNISNDINLPNKNQLDPFDIYTGTYLENVDYKKDETHLKTWTILDKQIIIYDEEPGSVILLYEDGGISYAHLTFLESLFKNTD